MISIKRNFLSTVAVASLALFAPSITVACGWNNVNHAKPHSWHIGNLGGGFCNICNICKPKPPVKPKPPIVIPGGHGQGGHGQGGHGQGGHGQGGHGQSSHGKVCGVVFYDANQNGRQDRGEKGTSRIFVTVLDSNGDKRRTRTSNDGSYCFNKVAVGNATVKVKEGTLPAHASLTSGSNPSSVKVRANKKNNAGKDGYILPQAQVVTPTGKVCGIVFNDINENGIQDNGEQGARGIKVSLLDAKGNRKSTQTRSTGSYCINKVAVGEATVLVDESTLPAHAHLTSGTNPNTVTVAKNKRNNAGKDGYVSANPGNPGNPGITD